ncbi:NAD(P)H-dependent oxidoreductase [Aggregatilinea lenta]|uniref:NAD(P)H-dependent oxidoreductase n=1 Tax=Aggregatilinea lenta TaxID=913108 RepID=UPI000E5B1ABF|nr:NAD(P)-dependent oxidoreductase [Aggregatilinea lenta]
MFGLSEDLKALETSERFIRTGLIGAGQMGTDIVSQVSLMPSQRVVLIADIDLDRAVNAYGIAGHNRECVAVAETLDDVNRARMQDKFVAVGDYRLVTDAPQIDAIIESTGHPEVSARAALRTLFQRKHLVTMSVEMDITVGPLLKWYADQHDVIYAIGAGDEPSALYELYDFATALGLTIVAAGKGKNNPLNRDAVPEDLAEEAARRGLTPEMLIEFVDGSKTMIEMACVANATGLVPDVFGLHGPHVNIAEFKDVFALKSQGGLLSQNGVVDYVIGDLAPGVFLVFTTDKPRLREALILRDMGHGPNYVLLRPFHLCSMEVPLSVAQAVVQGRSTMAPGRRLVAEVVSVAKVDLEPGRELERIGGHTHYSMTDRYENAAAKRALPVGIAKGAVITRPVKKGEIITYDDVQLPSGSVAIRLRELQDRWMAGEIEEPALLQTLNEIAAQNT